MDLREKRAKVSPCVALSQLARLADAEKESLASKKSAPILPAGAGAALPIASRLPLDSRRGRCHNYQRATRLGM